MKLFAAILVATTVATAAFADDLPKSTDQLWAEALWQSIPSNDASSYQVKALLVAALARAKNKAPIYVALADVDSGPVRQREMFNRIMRSVEREATTQATADLEKKLAEVDPNNLEAVEGTLQNLLGDSYSKAVQKKSVWSGIDELSKLSREGSDLSLMYYMAATAEEPTYKIAWYRLAKRATGDLAGRAVDGFMRNDPENAMAYYMRAIAQVETGDLAAALQCVKAGNAKPACRWYDVDVPERFALVFPDTEEYGKLGTNGQRIARTGLRYMLKHVDDAFAFSDPLPPNLRGVAYKLFDEGKRLQADGKPSEAAEYFEAVRGMGAFLMRAQPRDTYLMVTGLAISRVPRESLREVYDSQKHLEKLARLESFETAWKSYHERFGKAIDAMRPSNEELKLILIGERDGLAEERKLLELTLRESGLLDVLESKPKD